MELVLEDVIVEGILPMFNANYASRPGTVLLFCYYRFDHSFQPSTPSNFYSNYQGHTNQFGQGYFCPFNQQQQSFSPPHQYLLANYRPPSPHLSTSQHPPYAMILVLLFMLLEKVRILNKIFLLKVLNIFI